MPIGGIAARVSAGLFASSEKADEAGHGAPFDYAALPRHPSQLEERNEILAKTITVTIEVLLEMHPGVAVAAYAQPLSC